MATGRAQDALRDVDRVPDRNMPPMWSLTPSPRSRRGSAQLRPVAHLDQGKEMAPTRVRADRCLVISLRPAQPLAARSKRNTKGLLRQTSRNAPRSAHFSTSDLDDVCSRTQRTPSTNPRMGSPSQALDEVLR